MSGEEPDSVRWPPAPVTLLILLAATVVAIARCRPPDWGLEEVRLEAGATAPPLPVITGLRTEAHADFDRMTLELANDRSSGVANGSPPGVRGGYVDPPIIECGSGRPVRPVGDHRLEVRLEPAAAHTEAGEPTLPGREAATDGKVLRRVYRTCDFEGVVTFVLALSSRNPFRIRRLDDPPRVVVDVRRR